MAYTPDPTDNTQPVGSVKAGTADEEFRALKGYLKGLVLGAIQAGPADRQCALYGSQDATTGDANFLGIGTGLAVNLAATAAPLCLTYAGGSNATGDVNSSEVVGADVTSVVAGLAPSNVNYITKLFGGAWGSTLAPVQYGRVFNRTAQMLVLWPGANNAVATTEEFGNTLTFFGNAKLSTAVQILGVNTLACDGTGDYVSSPFTSVGADSWEIVGSFRTASIAAAQNVFMLSNAGGFGFILRIEIGGRLAAFISSNGTSADISAGTLGAATIAINTTYFYRVTFDAVAGTYRYYLSLNGAAETQDLTISSSLKLCAVTGFFIGASNVGGQGFNGNIGFTGFRRWASFTSAQAAGPTVAPTFTDFRSDFYNIVQRRMYQVTAASTVAGTNPTLTGVNKLYLGEAVTSAGAVISVISYAYRGEYDVVQLIGATNTTYTIATNVGAPTTMFVTASTRLAGLYDGFNEEVPYGSPGSAGNANYRGVPFGQLNRNTHRIRSQDFLQILDAAGGINANNPVGFFVRLSGKRSF